MGKRYIRPQKGIILQKTCDWNDTQKDVIPKGETVYIYDDTDKITTPYGGEPRVFTSVLYKGNMYMVPFNHVKAVSMKGRALEELSDANTKTQEAQGYPNIPQDAELEVVDVNFTNMYGTFMKVVYNGQAYYVNPDKVKITEGE